MNRKWGEGGRGILEIKGKKDRISYTGIYIKL